MPQASGSSESESVGISSMISSENNSPEIAVNSDFTIPDLPTNRVESSCRKAKVSYQYRSNSNNHRVKHHKRCQIGSMPLPGLEALRSPPSRDQINQLEIGKNLNQKSHGTTDSIKHSNRSISVEQLDRNLYKMKK